MEKKEQEETKHAVFHSCKMTFHDHCPSQLDRKDGYWVCDCFCHLKDKESN